MSRLVRDVPFHGLYVNSGIKPDQHKIQDPFDFGQLARPWPQTNLLSQPGPAMGITQQRKTAGVFQLPISFAFASYNASCQLEVRRLLG